MKNQKKTSQNEEKQAERNITTKSNPLRDKLVEELTKVCFLNSKYIDDMECAEENIEFRLPKECKPLKHFRFMPIFSFDIIQIDEGDCKIYYECEPLFDNYGFLIYVATLDNFINESEISDGYEIWLLDNMEIVVVETKRMMVGKKNNWEMATYRQKVKSGLYAYNFNFYPHIFVDEVMESIYKEMYGMSEEEYLSKFIYDKEES